MKKIMIVAALFVAMGFASCSNSPEAKAKAYAEKMVDALKDKDNAKLEEITKEAMEYEATLSEEDKKIFNEAGEKAAAELMKDVAKDLVGE